jgi:hypothetical protein
MIMLMIIMLSTLAAVSAFNLIPEVTFPSPMIIKPCNNIDPILMEAVHRVSKTFTSTGYPSFISYSGNTTTYVCNEFLGPNMPYGFMTTLESGNTKVTVSNTLLFYPTTLYNTVLHELLHAYGLDHSDEEGVMNYSLEVMFDQFKNEIVVNDKKKIWLSIDDLTGLFYKKSLNPVHW